MKPHIEETIKELSSRISVLQEAIKLLHALQDDMGWNGIANPLSSAPKQLNVQAEPVAQRPREVAVTVNHGRQKTKKTQVERNATGENVIEVARTLKEPFTGAELAMASGHTAKNAGNYITRWTEKGWIARTGFGEYQRTNKFPGQVSAQGDALLRDIHAEIDAEKSGE